MPQRARLAILLLAAVLSGCSRPGGGDGEQKTGVVIKGIGPYPAGAEGLKHLWSDILVAAQRDERERVHDLMASMIMTDEDLVSLFGEERGRWLKPRYQPMIARVVNIGAMELVSQIADRKYDDIEVVPVDEHAKSAADRAVLAALKTPAPIFSVRVKKKSESLGLRYDFFVYRSGRWTTGNQIGKYLAPPFVDAEHAPPTPSP